MPFRLAGSGAQFGLDGKAAYESDSICFEGKRYKGNVPRNEVISKISDLSLRDNGTDIWFLAATSSINTQLADDARKLGYKDGIAVVILDWDESELPALAVALAMGGKRVQQFLRNHLSGKADLDGALDALEEIRNHQDFTMHADRIKEQCSEASMGLALAITGNTKWLSSVFSDRRLARTKLGQQLSPSDESNATVLHRKELEGKLLPCLKGTVDEISFCVLGGEGNGKSWLVARSWLESAEKPLLIIIGPEYFNENFEDNSLIDILLPKLILQTGGTDKEASRERWRRRLKNWQTASSPYRPRLVVVIDGINQRPQIQWARIINSFGYELNLLGGKLMVTSRTPYFENHVKPAITEPCVEINVPQWTNQERDEILDANEIDVSELEVPVSELLRNPRILGIALELRKEGAIRDFRELSVSLLLFKHILMSVRDAQAPQPALEFMDMLCEHAREIMSRAKCDKFDDLTIFKGGIIAVADGRFFKPVPGEPFLYSLQEDGLTLALGFAILAQLRKAKRNRRNLANELEFLLEPIAALDRTADAVFAALTVNVLDHNYDNDVALSLVKGFSALQNPNQDWLSSFAGLARRRPLGFMDAAEELCLGGKYQANFDWIRAALMSASFSSEAWHKMTPKIKKWLSAYSLDPKIAALRDSQQNAGQAKQEELKKIKKRVEDKLKNLTVNEQAILKDLQETEGNILKLARLTLFILAGKPLEPFAQSLLNWCFSSALNAHPSHPLEEFKHLISLNRIDWSQTRKALLEAAAKLQDPNISTTGKWTLLFILRSTGNYDDDKDAQALYAGLTKDKNKLEGWRRVESYCTTDPCDPDSEEPENIKHTAERYADIDVTLLWQERSQTKESWFFKDARTGMARFKPKIAVAVHEKYAHDVLGRAGLPLRMGLFQLLRHNALLNIDFSKKLISKRRENWSLRKDTDMKDREAWIASQYQLLLAFPFLSAFEQAKIVIFDEQKGTFLRKVMICAKRLKDDDFECILGKLCKKDDEEGQYLLLTFAQYSGLICPSKARSNLVELIWSGSDRVRAEALGVIAQSDDEKLLREVVNSDWHADDANVDVELENWFGSWVLLEATKRGLIKSKETLGRISGRLYGPAALILDKDLTHQLAAIIDASIRHVVSQGETFVAPEIEIDRNESETKRPSLFSIHDRTSESKDIIDGLKHLSESNEDFKRRQKRRQTLFQELVAKLNYNKAKIVLDRISLKEFSTLLSNSKEFGDQWFDLFMNEPYSYLHPVYNLILLTAASLGATDPEKSIALFSKAKTCRPLVRFTYGKAKVPFEVIAAWDGASNSILNNMRFARLDEAANDYELSTEVLAALMRGKEDILFEYIENRINQEHPAEVARAIMVVGFSNVSDFNSKILDRFKGKAGLIGSAYQAANYAYERNVWARHWLRLMSRTDDNTEFWRYSVLFLKIVDGRYDLWVSDFKQKGKPYNLFMPSLNDEFEKRIKRWRTHRESKLFGQGAPDRVFLRVKS